MLRRRTLLVLTLVGLVPAFVLVSSLVGLARDRRQHLADDWAARGARDLAAGRPDGAAEDFRAAQEYARDHSQYRLQLAQALVAAGRALEARSELETLWSEAPGSGLVNLQLARLAARTAADADAVRFYHGAIDGAWDAEAGVSRRRARLELAQLLFDRHELPLAQAELTVLTGDPPVDPAASRLAGEVAFRLGDYRAAARNLSAAARAGALDPPRAALLDVSTRVLALDPYARGISSRDRLRRVLRAYGVAVAALRRCPSDALSDGRTQADDLRPVMTERALARDPDAVDRALSAIAQIESAVVAACGPGSGAERALDLVLRTGRGRS